MIDIEELIFEYPGHRALNGITLHIPQGSVTALVGPNGAGKSTLLRCIAGLDKPLSGHLHVHRIPVLEQPREVHRHLGYLSDFYGLYDQLTVNQGLLYAAYARGLSHAHAQQRVSQIAQSLDIVELLARKPTQLSRGQRQRLAIGQAIVHQPLVLLLDEPASGLDPDARDNLAQLFRQLHAQGMTLVVSSHILNELDAYCTHLLSIRQGRVEHHGALHSHADATSEMLYIVEIAPSSPSEAPTQRQMLLPRDPVARANQIAQWIQQGQIISGLWPARDSVQAEYLRHRDATQTSAANRPSNLWEQPLLPKDQP